MFEKELHKIDSKIDEINRAGNISSAKPAQTKDQIKKIENKISFACLSELDNLMNEARNLASSLIGKINQRKVFLENVAQSEIWSNLYFIKALCSTGFFLMFSINFCYEV